MSNVWFSDRSEGAWGVDPMAHHVHPDRAQKAAHNTDTADPKVREPAIYGWFNKVMPVEMQTCWQLK